MTPDIDQEREALRRLIGTQSQKEIALRFGIQGGPSMLSQHLSGNRPISLEAGIKYAKGFGVPLSTISQRLAAVAAEAAALADTETQTPSTHERTAPSVDEALNRIAVELARDLPEFTREDLADEMGKWVRRKGAEHSRQRVAQPLGQTDAAQAEPGKRTGTR